MSLIGLVGAFVDSMGGLHEPLKEADPEDSIQVCVRIRPILKDERGLESSAWTWGENVIKSHNSIHLPYTFDHLFFPENSNNDIFNSVVKNVVLRSMQGVHGSVFTYGQTSSGKTFTMNGSQAQPGIIPQSIFYCFESIQNEFTDREFLFRVSYIEVYNEQVKDLLSTEPTQIKIQYDPKLGTQLSGVKEEVVVSPHQVIALLKAGEAHRHVGSTDMNEKSSRAHTLFKLIIESKLKGDAADTPVRVSNLNLVDLAGSENAKMTNSVGERAREAKHINQSLLTLSLIIQRLSEEKPGSAKRQYLPYRDSKLTRLLQASLSGNAHIAVICTVSSTQRCVEETHNTLKFAARAKKIKTNAVVNEMMDDKTLLRAYKMEIFNLKARLVAMEDKPKLDRDSQAKFIDGSEGEELETNDFDERREEGEEIVHEVILLKSFGTE
jgi:centromeric protein E